MYYKLKEGLALRGWDRLPNAIVDTRSARTRFIGKREMDALELCNGKINLSLPFIPEYIRELLPALERNGIISRCACGDSIREYQAYRRYPARYIKSAHWSVTGKCNYRCKHCYMSAPDAKYGELPHETVMDIVRQLAECGVMEVSLTGGEPLVREDFIEIVDALLANGIRVTTIYSNGLLVTDALLAALAARNCFPEFNISFDGVGHHDWLRGIDGAERAAEEAFVRCRDSGFATGAEMCLHRGNMSVMRESVRKLSEWGCRGLKTNPVANVGAWRESGRGESLPDDALYEAYLEYIPQYYADGMPLSIQLGGFFSANSNNPDTFGIPAIKTCEDPKTACVCGHARLVSYIAADGRVLPCMALSGMEIQDEFPLITEIGLARCVADSRYMRLIDTRASEYLEQNPACAACEYAMQCFGGCRAGALESSPRGVMTPDPHTCRLFKGGWIPKIIAAAQSARPGAALGL